MTRTAHNVNQLYIQAYRTHFDRLHPQIHARNLRIIADTPMQTDTAVVLPALPAADAQEIQPAIPPPHPRYYQPDL